MKPQRILSLLENKAYQDVHTLCIAAIHENIDDPAPYCGLAIIACEHGNWDKGLELFDKAIDYAPNKTFYITQKAKILLNAGRKQEARVEIERLSLEQIQDAYTADTLGVVLSKLGQHETAIPLFKKAVNSRPDEANYQYNLAASAQFSGDFELAKDAYEKTLALDPKFYRAWSSLVSLSKQTPGDNHLERLVDIFETVSHEPDASLQLGHAIAKTLEDLGRHEDSFDWLLKAKRAKKKALPYDRKAGAALFEAARQTARFENRDAGYTGQVTPIFIVGLPRTGTTLVDRILSSHADVVSAGELNVFAEIIKKAANTPSNHVMDAETFSHCQSLNHNAIGRAYLDATKNKTNGATYIVDKMPLNFFYAGLIHHALPEARIIALRRGAMDSCLSNFRQLFSTQHSYYNYTFDVEDTAEFYRGFDALMAHWRQNLPSDRFIEVRYEDIVFKQEEQTRRLLRFCDLDWDDACMRFHENSAPVSTASSVQVRQPLYSGSIGRWKKYGNKLQTLQTALGSVDNQV